MPDGSGEKVACLVVPDDEYDISLSRSELRKRVEEQFREVSATLPYYKRVKVLHITDIELPRTATRKVKRGEVIEIMQTLEQSEKSGKVAFGREPADTDSQWLVRIVASVSNRPRQEISLNSRLADLGFDSLMFVELATAIENAGGAISAPERFNEVQDLRELVSVVSKRSANAASSDGSQTGVEDRRSDDDAGSLAGLRARARLLGWRSC